MGRGREGRIEDEEEGGGVDEKRGGVLFPGGKDVWLRSSNRDSLTF